VVQGIVRLIVSSRDWLARIAGLRWARVGGWDLAVPAAAVLVVFNAIPQLGRELWGIPFWLVWIVATAIAVATLIAARSIGGPGGKSRLAGPAILLLAGIVVSWVLYDILFWQQPNNLYDLNVYLGSAARWLNGGQAYMTAAVSSWPYGPRNDFFLYPPPLLPLFGLLSRLPDAPVALGFTAAMVACAYKAYRFLGLSRALSLILLTFPPVMIGFESGNIASLTFLLFAAAVKSGGTLIVDGLFKVQTGIPALWLIRQRRWRGVLAGTGTVLVIILVTLPIVGLASWRAWWDALGYRAASQAVVPALYGFSYAKSLPGEAYSLLCVAFVGLALLFRGRPGLAALGLASIFASPALWPHGFVFALPAVLMLESGSAVWIILGAGAFGPNMWLLFMAGWVAVLGARRLPAGALHPLQGRDSPWPRPTGPRPLRRMAATPDTGTPVTPGSGE
jgi:hypothetical protein